MTTKEKIDAAAKITAEQLQARVQSGGDLYDAEFLQLVAEQTRNFLASRKEYLEQIKRDTVSARKLVVDALDGGGTQRALPWRQQNRVARRA